MPDYPTIEGIRKLELETLLPANFHKVKYGDYEFTECKEGYVQVHMKGWVDKRDVSNLIAGYGVSFGKADHPL